jgi:hypothetical protein
LPGSTDQSANVVLLALGLRMIPIAITPSLAGVGLVVAACGLWFAPLNALRTIILGRALPASQLSEGFSTLSAAMLIGYGASGVATGVILGVAGVRACFLIAGAVAILSGVGAACLDLRQDAPTARL